MREVEQDIRLQDRAGELDAVHAVKRRLDRKGFEIPFILSADRNDPAAENLFGIATVDRAGNITPEIGDEHFPGSRLPHGLNQFPDEKRMNRRKTAAAAEMHLHGDGAVPDGGRQIELFEQTLKFVADRIGRLQCFRGESGKQQSGTHLIPRFFVI